MFWNNLAVAANFFVEIAVELIVLFIGITFLVGLIQEYVPDETIKKALGGRHKILGSILGAGFGALTPFCSCSTIPMLLGMLNAGVPFASAMAFLFASPLLNPVIISLFVILMGWKVAALYFAVTFVGAIAIGLLLDALGFASQVKSVAAVRSCCDCQQATDARSRIQRSAAIRIRPIPSARALSPVRSRHWCIHSWIRSYGDHLPLRRAGQSPGRSCGRNHRYSHLHSGGDHDPHWPGLIEKGMSVGAVLALVIGGAGASIPELTLLSAIFEKKLLAAFVLTIFCIAVAAGYLANLLVSLG